MLSSGTISRILSLLPLFWGVQSNPTLALKDGFQIGCLQCHGIDENKLNVHLIPHSHNDVGWLKTYDQYYYGMNPHIYKASVQDIINSVVDALLTNPERRFIQVETAFFWKWWNDQTPLRRQQFKGLVDNGQIEMANGAWTMNDEACTNYQSTIDQFTWGLRRLEETVGKCGIPRIGWQIDPFGHSREQASIFAQLGFDGIFLSRISHDELVDRKTKATMEFLWQSSANLNNTPIYTNVMPDGYGEPDKFCWDILCDDDPIDDDPDSPDNNVDDKVQDFTWLVEKYRTFYETNNLMITMGSDFHFAAAEGNFVNMDKLIKAFDNNANISVFYSTPSCYIAAVNKSKPTLTLKTEDFFPYNSEDHEYWTGYFTSRPNSKRFERIGHNILQVTKQLYAFASVKTSNTSYEAHLRELREASATLQHHDAITGTERQHVASDYVRLLTKGISKAEERIGETLKDLLGIAENNITLKMSSCLLSNISICDVSQNSAKMIVIVHNPLAWKVSHYVRLPVGNDTFLIKGPDGIQEYDLVPIWGNFSFVIIPGSKPSQFDLVFEAKDLPPLGFKIYHIEKSGKKAPAVVQPKFNGDVTLGWDDTKFTIDAETNLLKSITIGEKTQNMTQNFYFYESRGSFVGPVSGAYVSVPNTTYPLQLSANVRRNRIFNGSLVKEFHQEWLDPLMNISQCVRVYKSGGHVEFDWMVGNVSGSDDVGREVISRFTTTDQSFKNSVFYTDSNGREMMKRTKNSRPDYTYNSSAEPVAGNYYPVTSMMVIKGSDHDTELAVITDRAQGGTSLNKGEIELMVHRRLYVDDGKGVGEPLNDYEFEYGTFVRGSHWVLFGSAKNKNGSTAAKERILAQKKLLQPWIGLASTNQSYDDFKEIQNVSYSGLNNEFPENVNILTFEPWKNNSYILRLEHIFEQDEDAVLSLTSKIDLASLFGHFKFKTIVETNLGANLLLQELQQRSKYDWTWNGTAMNVVGYVGDDSPTNISLTPMQIRTFIVTVGEDEGNFAVRVKPAVMLLVVVLVNTVFVL